MHLLSLSLKNFRNFSELSLKAHPRLNIFVGPNAQGKTNILEAIHFLAFGKSFRLQHYPELIRFGEAQSRIGAWLEAPVGSEERTAFLTAEKKIFAKDGKKTTPNQFKSMPLVLFAPEVILLLKESPQARRDYADGLISKLSPTYGDHWTRYKKALSQRNKLLKDEALSPEEKRKQMALWETPLVEEGGCLIQERREWLARLSEKTALHYHTIAGSLEKKVGLEYHPHTEPENLERRFEERREEELQREMTLVGPHRDEISPCLRWEVGGSPERAAGGAIRAFGSQGEMRSFTLAMKLAEIQLFEEILGRSPILLLDDVVSELDERRSRLFFDYLQTFKGQVFATATAITLFPANSLKNFAGFGVEKGQISALLSTPPLIG